MEDETGFALFERVGRGLGLTDQGQVFLRKARATLVAFHDVQKTAEDIRDNHGRRLRVCAIGPLSFGALVPKAVASFAQSHPEFSLLFEPKFRIDIEEWVAQGWSDLGFTLLPVSHPALQSRALESVRTVAVVPADHALANRSHLEPVDLVDTPMIMPHSAARVRALFDASFLSASLCLSPRIETSNAISSVYLVSQGAGVSVLDPFSCLSIPKDEVRLIPWMPETKRPPSRAA